jgi:hypothetical protein
VASAGVSRQGRKVLRFIGHRLTYPDISVTPHYATGRGLGAENSHTPKFSFFGSLFGFFEGFLRIKCMFFQFVLSSFFHTFVDSTGLIEFVPSILTSFFDFMPVSIAVSLKSLYNPAAIGRARKFVWALLRIRSTSFRFFWSSF